MEDEKEIRNYLKKSLESECYAVDLAEDGEKGIKCALANNYDLICLDNIMPKKTGKEVCETLRQRGISTPIIMLSVKSEVTTKVDLLNAGADDYLTKPFSIDELSARMKALLRRPSAIEKEVYKIDNLYVDYNRHLVKRGDKNITLTRKELALLKYLMQNRGTVLSKSMIMEHVWDIGVDPFSNTIESHILSLRKKIDIPREKKLIHTISGRGYKLETL